MQQKSYRNANKEQIRVQHRNWRNENAEKVREYSRKRHALKHQTQVEPINEKEVYLRDGWICQICHKRVNKKLRYPDPMSPSMDHIIPLSKDGTHMYSNVQLTHWGCNNKKKNANLPQGEQLRIF